MDVSDASVAGRSSSSLSPTIEGSSTTTDPVVDADSAEDVNFKVAVVVVVVVVFSFDDEMVRETSSGNNRVAEDRRRKSQCRKTNADDNVGNISTQ